MSRLIPWLRTMRRRPAFLSVTALVVAIGCNQQDAGQTTEADGTEAARPAKVDLSIASPSEGGSAAETSASKESSNRKPAALVLPETASPEELVAFLNRANQQNVTGETEEEALANIKAHCELIIAACDKILAAKAAPPARFEAAANKFNAMQMLSRYGIAKSRAPFVAFAKNAEGIVDGILAETKEEDLRVAATGLKLNALLMQAGEDETKGDTFLAAAKTAAADKNSALAAQARETVVQYHLGRLFSGHADEGPQLVALLKTQLEAAPQSLGTAQEVAGALESQGQRQPCRELLAAIKEAAGKQEDPKAAEAVQGWAEALEFRLDVIGKPVTIEGTLADGRPFDWKQLRGKVVLVDFWATWCTPCVKLLPEIAELREKYAEQGFEVVGISLDRNDQELERFLKLRPLPWPIVANILGTADEVREKNAERFHVDAIPMVVLFDAEGKVESLGLKGEELDARIRRLLAK